MQAVIANSFRKSDPTTVGEVLVWVMEPAPGTVADTYQFPWDWSRWRVEDRLIPSGMGTHTAGMMGSQSFRLLRQSRMEPSDVVHTVYPHHVREGAWVCITCGIGRAEAITPEDVQWWGRIATIDADVLAVSGETVGTVVARQIGHMLDQTPVRGWARASGDGNYPDGINSPPSANIGTASGVVIGNAIFQSSYGWLFCRNPAELGTTDSQYWSRWRLLNHVLFICGVKISGGPSAPVGPQPAWPGWIIQTMDNYQPGPTLPVVTAGTLAKFLDNTEFPITYELDKLSWKGVFDMLLPRVGGLGWEIRLVGTAPEVKWQIFIFGYDDTGAYMPVNTPVDADTTEENEVSVSIKTDAVDLVDEVIVEGDRVIWMVTVGVGDGNFGAAWLAATELAMRSEPKPDNMGLPEYQDVYTLYRLTTPGSQNDLRIKGPVATPGAGAHSAGPEWPMCPQIEWSGTALSITGPVADATNRSPYLPTARLARSLPWPEGVSADGTDRRHAQRKVQPSYLSPRIFLYDSIAPVSRKWVPLNKIIDKIEWNINNLTNDPSVCIDDRGCGLKIDFSPVQAIARGTWNVGFLPLAANITPYDYRDLYATIAIPSDQRMLITKRRPGIEADKVLNRLIIRDERLSCWVASSSAILGVKDVAGVQTPQYVNITAPNGAAWVPPTAGSALKDNGGAGSGTTVGWFTRNDWGAAERYAVQLSAWAFRKRSGATIMLARPDVPPSWAQIGKMIARVVEVGGVATTVNSVVEVTGKSWDESPRLMVQTVIPPQPQRMASSPSGGGPVSLGLGGTTGSALQDVQFKTAKLEADAQRLPVVMPRTAPTSIIPALFNVLGSDVLTTIASTQFKGVGTSGTVPTSVPQADPAALTSFPACLGKARLGTRDSGTWVWIATQCNPGTGTVSDTLSSIPNDQAFLSRTTVRMPIAASSDFVTVYLPWDF